MNEQAANPVKFIRPDAIYSVNTLANARVLLTLLMGCSLFINERHSDNSVFCRNSSPNIQPTKPLLVVTFITEFQDFFLLF